MPDSASWLTPDLLGAVDEGIVVLDRRLHYLFVNPAAEALVQMPASDVVGRFIWDLFPHPPESPFRLAIEQALATGAPTYYRGFNPRRGRWFEQHTYPYSGGLVTLFRDVTDEEAAQQRLVESESRFRRTADSVPVLVWTSDLSRGRVFFNRAWTDYTGRTAATDGGEGWVEGVHPDDRAALLALYESSFAAEAPFETVYRLRRGDGVYRRMLVRGHPRYDVDGAFEGFTGACTDIDERWAAEQQVAFLANASELLLASSLNYEETLARIAALAVPTLADWCSVQMVDEDGTVLRTINLHADPDKIRWADEISARYPTSLDTSDGLRRVVETGESILVSDVTPEMIEAAPYDEGYRQILREVGMTSVLVVPLRTRTRVVGALTLIATHGNRRYEASDLRFAEELARRAAVAAENAALYRSARDAEAALRALNDALEARVVQRTEELAEANHVLALRNRELQDFAFVASHDLQEPLRKIRAFSDLLSTDYADVLDEEGRHYLRRVGDAAARMSRLIADLLAFSRVATQGGGFTDVALGEALDGALSDVEFRLEQSGGRVEAATLPVVHGDALQLRQLFVNLVGNALKFQRPGVPPEVHVSATQRPGHVELVVADNGIGFEQKYAERVFTPFQRLHAREAYEGTGMGLAIVRRIAERHGGTVRVESAPGAGSRFVVTLPG